MQKDTVNHIVIKPETRSKLKFKKDSEPVIKRTIVSNESLPSGIGVNFNSKDELKEQKLLSFREYL